MLLSVCAVPVVPSPPMPALHLTSPTAVLLLFVQCATASRTSGSPFQTPAERKAQCLIYQKAWQHSVFQRQAVQSWLTALFYCTCSFLQHWYAANCFPALAQTGEQEGVVSLSSKPHFHPEFQGLYFKLKRSTSTVFINKISLRMLCSLLLARRKMTKQDKCFYLL